jgi:hypothetical protein
MTGHSLVRSPLGGLNRHRCRCEWSGLAQLTARILKGGLHIIRRCATLPYQPRPCRTDGTVRRSQWRPSWCAISHRRAPWKYWDMRPSAHAQLKMWTPHRDNLPMADAANTAGHFLTTYTLHLQDDSRYEMYHAGSYTTSLQHTRH